MERNELLQKIQAEIDEIGAIKKVIGENQPSPTVKALLDVYDKIVDVYKVFLAPEVDDGERDPAYGTNDKGAKDAASGKEDAADIDDGKGKDDDNDDDDDDDWI